MSGVVQVIHRRCGCGVDIVVKGRSVQDTVRAHILSPTHQEWRALGGLAYDPEAQGRSLPPARLWRARWWV